MPQRNEYPTLISAPSFLLSCAVACATTIYNTISYIMAYIVHHNDCKDPQIRQHVTIETIYTLMQRLDQSFNMLLHNKWTAVGVSTVYYIITISSRC